MTTAETVRNNRWYLLGLLVLLVALYWKIFPFMVQQWYQDDNYSHGFMVPFIAGYFLYLRWDELKQTPASRSNAGLVLLLLGLLQLLIGWIGTEYFSMRSSLVVILAGLVLYLLGPGVFKIARLSLAYLFFMIPIPYIIYDSVAFPLKVFVTRVSVAALRAIGIVVMREGNIIMFPSLTLEVADACSGVRSLISLMALAVAYAFFIRTSTAKRILLICSAVPIAIFTNATRVIVTGILAQYWGARAAEGFFHEFAGMLVFAVAMLMLVSFGGLLKKGTKEETGQEAPRPRTQRSEADSGALRARTAHFLAAYFLMTLVALYVNLHTDLEVPTNKPLDQFPREVSGWRMTREYPMTPEIQKVLMATDTLSRSYVTPDGKTVDLYIGYHGGGKGSGEIHSPKHCLPGTGWLELSTTNRMLDISGTKVCLVQAVYQKGGSRQLFLYWFQVQAKTISDEYSLKIAEIVNSVVNRRRDASFIRISLPFENNEREAVATGERFARDFLPAIRQFLPE